MMQYVKLTEMSVGSVIVHQQWDPVHHICVSNPHIVRKPFITFLLFSQSIQLELIFFY